MSRRSLASLLLAGTTIFILAACTPGEPVTVVPPTAAKPRPIAPSELIAEGDRLAVTGDLYAAIESYMAARRSDPADADAAARLGLALADQGRHAEALPHLKDAQRARTDDLAITQALVNALLALERPDQAAAKLAPVLAQHPSDARLWNASGIAADMLGDSDAAAAAYRSGLAAAPDNQALKVNLALSRFASGDTAGATKAAADAGLSMREVQARADRLIAYRNRALGQVPASATAGLGPVPEAPPMVALAMPPVRVQELPPVTVPAVPAITAAVEQPVPASAPTAEIPPAKAAAPSGGAAQLEPPAPAETVQIAEPQTQAPATTTEVVASAPPAAPEVTAESRPETAPAEPTAAPEVAPTAAPEPMPAASSWSHAGGPQVQIAAYGRASLAEAQWAKMKVEHAALLEGLEPVIQRAELGTDKGVVYRLRLAVADAGAGRALCEKLQHAGLDCVPVPAL